MPALSETPFVGTVTWLGVVHDSTADIRAQPTTCLDLTLAGQEGECHAGLTRPSCSRVMNLYPKGTIIRNTRQLSILSAEEILQIASNLGQRRGQPLEKELDPRSLGASMVLEGIPDLSFLPPNSRLITERGTTITIDLENAPCMFTGQVVLADHPDIGHWNSFKPAATGLRGVTAWVEREGTVQVGDRVRLFVPVQRQWVHLDEYTVNKEAERWSWWCSWRKRQGDPMTALSAQLMCMLLAGMVFAIVGVLYVEDRR